MVETKAGASGTIAAEYVARSEPDGCRLLVTIPGLFKILPFMMENIRVHARDFVPIRQIADAPTLLPCDPQLPARNAREFVRLVQKDSALNLASAAASRAQVCLVCGWVYEEAKGDPDHCVPPGSRWEDVPDDWCCPECGVDKTEFRMLEP